MTNELLAAVQADHYVFSNNHAIFKHPNDESVAWVLVQGGQAADDLVHSETQRNRRRADTARRAKYGYEAKCPAGADLGVALA